MTQQTEPAVDDTIADTIESYVHEVCRFIPAKLRKEVFEDLLAAIYEEVEARGEAAASDPTLQDVAEVLGNFGHPLKVAGRYQPPRYLIGPDLYPVFLRTLGVLLVAAIGLQVVVGLALGFADGWAVGFWQMFGISIDILLWVSAVVFVVFIILEVAGEKFDWYARWSPDIVGKSVLGTINRQDVVTNLISEGFFLLWFNSVVVITVFDSEHLPLVSLAPVWQTYFWPLNLLVGGCFLLHLYVLVAGVWKRLPLIAEVVMNSALIGLGLVLLLAGDLLIVDDSVATRIGPHIQNVVKSIVAVIIAVTAWDVYRSLRMWQGVVR